MKFGVLMAAAWISLAPVANHAAAPAPSVTSAETTPTADGYEVRWTLSQAGAPATLYVADRADDTQTLKRVADQDILGAAAVSRASAAGVRPYFYVLPEGAARGLWTATRVVPLQGAGNFRDLGGYEAANGRHVVWGQLFRSNGLSNLTDADYKTLDQLGVKVVCDLRTRQERQKQPTVWQGRAPVFDESAKPVLDFDLQAALGTGKPDPDHVRRYMIGVYRTMIDAYAPEYRSMLQHLLAGETPLIVHCTAGKDRTGIGSALILTALGVPRATVVSDYALSGTLLYGRQMDARGHAKPDPTAQALAGLPPEVIKTLLASDPPYILAALDRAAEEYGSVDAYMEKKLGVGPRERAALRARYLR